MGQGRSKHSSTNLKTARETTGSTETRSSAHSKSLSTDQDAPNRRPNLTEISCEYPHRDIEEEMYFHGAVPALEAKFMLKRERSFLVRRTTVKGRHYFVLTFKWDNKNHDMLIRRASNANTYYIYKHCALNIPELIEFHCSSKEPVNSKGAQIEYAVRRRDWSLYIQQVLIGQEIGKGEFGLVFNAQVLRLYLPNKSAVLKVLQRSSQMSSDERSRLMREAYLMMSLKHKNIIQIYGICSDGNNMLMALERASGGSLLNYLRKKPRSTKKKKNFCKDVIKGIAYLSTEGVVHRDLAARNCLVSGSGCVKVADFGLSFWGGKQLRLKEGKAPVRWLPPEVLKESSYSTKSDTWSLGVVFFEIWADGCRPYDEMNNQEAKIFVLSGKTLQPPEGMPIQYQILMATCFEYDVEKRPTPIEIRDLIKYGNLLKIPVIQEPTEMQETTAIETQEPIVETTDGNK